MIRRVIYLNMFLIFRIDNNVSNSFEEAISQYKQLLQRGPMRVHDPLPLGEGPPREALLPQLLQELMVEVGRVHLHVFLLLRLLGQVDVRELFRPFLEVGHPTLG
jgi:hypothetical protein